MATPIEQLLNPEAAAASKACSMATEAVSETLRAAGYPSPHAAYRSIDSSIPNTWPES
jgi:methylphosphotriester-DNA--protein-cysteine methyltransferase